MQPWDWLGLAICAAGDDGTSFSCRVRLMLQPSEIDAWFLDRSKMVVCGCDARCRPYG